MRDTLARFVARLGGGDGLTRQFPSVVLAVACYDHRRSIVLCREPHVLLLRGRPRVNPLTLDNRSFNLSVEEDFDEDLLQLILDGESEKSVASFRSVVA